MKNHEGIAGPGGAQETALTVVLDNKYDSAHHEINFCGDLSL